MKTILYLCLAVTITACNSAQPAAKETDTLTVETMDSASTDDDDFDASAKQAAYVTGAHKIHFADRSLVFSCDIEMDIRENKDTIFLSTKEYGVSMENGDEFMVASDSLEDLIVAQSYETVAGVAGKEPCLLEGWKVYQSEEQTLIPDERDAYTLKTYTEDEHKLFPDVNIDELKNEVLTGCGQEYYDLVKDIKTLPEGAAVVVLHKIYLRITGINKAGNAVSKIVVYYPDLEGFD
ncbi:hypothetical protein [Chitinophaga barathri]|uniref:DUF4377 domain-containing protein n=1 Tax=Chitinophaga barathri TaxID=1647451 RepID=A0A3N4MU59_9BACT|nr:hypothetical protein [Chitinophaga barathri]RPD38953.1 hypothetical protein EG028_22685 [Chitinophaga barathri]